MRNQKHARYNLTAILASLIFLSSLVEGFAQSQNTSKSGDDTKGDDQIIRCPVYMTVVEVEVEDKQGKKVSDLSKDDFIVCEDGVRQELQFWQRRGALETESKQAAYKMGYFPSNQVFNGKFRKIRVEARTKDERKLRVKFSPEGYYAKKELLK